MSKPLIPTEAEHNYCFLHRPSVISFMIVTFLCILLTPEPPSNKPKIIVQDQSAYVSALSKFETCEKLIDPNKDIYFNCPDGTKGSMIHWSRDQGTRTGIVTRLIDKNGNVIMMYGHPDNN